MLKSWGIINIQVYRRDSSFIYIYIWINLIYLVITTSSY